MLTHRDLLERCVIVTSVLDASVLYQAKVTNNGLAQLEARTLRTLRPHIYHPSAYHFDYLLIDEAAQASEPEIAPALAVVLPETSLLLHKAEHKNRRIPQLVLCGDHMQLGPNISSAVARLHELDLSLLQRLFERPFYKDHPRARHNLPAACGLRLLRPFTLPSTQNFDGQDDWLLEQDDDKIEGRDKLDSMDLSVPFANFINNYRSHPGLLMIPSALFYNDTLEPCASSQIQSTPLLNWCEQRGNGIPLLFWHTEGQEEMFEEGASWYNLLEVARVVETVVSLVKSPTSAHGSVKASEISIIAPFREQVRFLNFGLLTMLTLIKKGLAHTFST